MPARGLVQFEGFGEIVETDVEKRQIAEDSRQTFGIIVGQHLLVSALVKCERLGEPILPVIDISNVDIQPSQPTSISLLLEDCARTVPGGECLIVPAQQQERLNRSTKSPGKFRFF